MASPTLPLPEGSASTAPPQPAPSRTPSTGPGGPDLRQWSASAIAAAVRTGELSAVEVISEFAEAIDRAADLRAVVTPCPERALARARQVPAGALSGVPLLVKDIYDTAGLRTAYGSRIFANRVPRGTAAAVTRLEGAGAIVVGKANLHEFAWGVTSQNSHWGDVVNPVRPGRVAGGSSGGNAAGLAAGLATLGLGTDTGGSGRIPSACCDTVGFKPTLGRISLAGTFPLAPSFDTASPMARTVADCALMYAVLSGEPVPTPRLAGVRIGVLGPCPEADQLAALGAELEAVELPVPAADLMPLFSAQCALTHRGLYPERVDEYGLDLQVKLESAQTVPAVAYLAAQRALPRWRRLLHTVPEVDLLISPTLAIEVPLADCWEPDVRAGMCQYTRPFNFLGWPAIAIGNLQLAGRSDQTVLAAALAWEDANGPPGDGLETAAAER